MSFTFQSSPLGQLTGTSMGFCLKPQLCLGLPFPVASPPNLAPSLRQSISTEPDDKESERMPARPRGASPASHSWAPYPRPFTLDPQKL